ncbi:uncharacterized protein V6R79_003336 [Siganus canaliculatus]
MLWLSLLLLLLPHLASSVLLGWVESPGYPHGYMPHSSLLWNRCAHKGHILSLRLIHLNIEDSKDCENDAVKVFSNGELTSVLCGKMDFEELQLTVNPLLVSAPGGCLTLKFHSDYSNPRRYSGFRGFYSDHDFDECQDDPDNACTQFCHNFIGGYHCSCRHGYYLDEDKHTCTVNCSRDLSGETSGDITSPSYPASYAENANCEHTLSVDSDLQLELHFSENFDLEQSSDGQCIDSLTVETPTRTLGPFCGNKPPPSPLLTHSSKVIVRFTSDSFGSNKGFTAHFKTVDKVCPAVVTPHSTVTPQKPEYTRGQTVTVKCNNGYIINTEEDNRHMALNYMSVCQSTGEWHPTFACEPVDCGLPRLPADGILELVHSDNQRTHYEDKLQFRCSSAYYKLEGDDTYTCSDSGEWKSDSGNTSMPKCTEVCGLPDTTASNLGRIMGGEPATLGQIPWYLLIKVPSRGGASLINDRWAVTAAHVVENVRDETALRLYGSLINDRATQGIAIMDSLKIIIHPGYGRVRPGSAQTNYDNDIALIRFESRVTLGPNLMPICLPDPNRGFIEGEQGTVSGFGYTDVKPKRFAQSDVLKYAHIGVKSLAECHNTPPAKSGEAMIFTNNMFCAGAEGKDSCRRDSGGPFVSPMLSDTQRPFLLTGIVSWGPPCKLRQYKGYYTKVENYVDWIKETIDTVEKSLNQ